MSLPDELAGQIVKALDAAGDPGPLTGIAPVGGGDINRAARVSTEHGLYFVKWHPNPPAGMFACEADGLRRLGEAGARVPNVIAGGGNFLILEWLETGPKSDKSAAALGGMVALMHRAEAEPPGDGKPYGLAQDNYIGRLAQSNAPCESWVEFYATRRLGVQRDLAARLGRLPDTRARLLDQLIGRLGEWINESACRPSLVHGDLWSGNWLATSDGLPAMIDPAVYIGDREVDLAMSALFGGFPQSFYDAYQEAFPLAAGWQERQPIYQLYHLLTHLNMFGEGYGGSVDGTLRRYAA